MSSLYVTDSGSKLHLDGGHIVVEKKDESEVKVPKETIDSIMLFGNISITTPLMKECLKKGINVSLFSRTGKYFGKLVSTSHGNVNRLKKQVFASEDHEFALNLSKTIVKAKINNQKTLLDRYLRRIDDKISTSELKVMEKKVNNTAYIEQLIGYEGMASKIYFDVISKIIKSDFKFSGRSRQPPRDPYNSMLSLGYTMLMYEIVGMIESRGLHPYVGFLHQDRERHPTLASDLMEEWRAIIVDSVVLSLIQKNEISIDNFWTDKNGGVLIKKEGLDIFIRKLQKKLMTEVAYKSDKSEKKSYRQIMGEQVMHLSRAIELKDPSFYKPIRIR